MSKINVYKVILAKRLEFEMEADSPENALKAVREMVDDDGMFWIQEEEEEPIVEEIEGYHCPSCGSSLRYESMSTEGKVLNKVYSCMIDDCALDWTITEDVDNGIFLGIHRYFHG